MREERGLAECKGLVEVDPGDNRQPRVRLRPVPRSASEREGVGEEHDSVAWVAAWIWQQDAKIEIDDRRQTGILDAHRDYTLVARREIVTVRSDREA